MATRKGVNISGNYAAPHILHALFIHVLCILKNESSDRIVFYILLNTHRIDDTVRSPCRLIVKQKCTTLH